MRLRRPDGVSRGTVVRGTLALTIALLLAYAGVATATYDATGTGAGNITDPANGTTVISVQGFHFKGTANAKKPARLVAAGPNGSIEWVHGSDRRRAWFYDVDPMENGNLFVTSTVPGDTVLYEYDPETNSRVWEQRLDAKDTHDADLSRGGEEILVANLRNWNESARENQDRVYVYDRSRDEIVWEWDFDRAFDPHQGGDYQGDWTHVNDVDRVGENLYMVSPRNMDTVLVVNRTTKEVELRLGEDGNHDVLFAQHNPDFFRDEAGNPVILVADSENDRVVEYTRVDGVWEETWAVTGFNWPRDADRLPNGNTLVVDSLNHRVVEITPEGRVVWEFYAPWAPYDAERVAHGPGSNTSGPAMRDAAVGGTYEVHGGDDEIRRTNATVGDVLIAVTEDTPVEGPVGWFAHRWAHVSPFVRPVWMSGWAFFALVCALAVGLAWGAGEAVHRRRRIRRHLGGVRRRVRRARDPDEGSSPESDD